MINLVTRAGKGSELDWNDFDNNWGNIQNAVNALGGQQLYNLQAVASVNQCQVDHSNKLLINGSIRLLKAPPVNPCIKHVITVNGVIANANQYNDYYVGAAYPLADNAISTGFEEEITLHHADYPATVKVYLHDEQGNYAAPVTILVSDDPCRTPEESIVFNSYGLADGGGGTQNLTVNLDLANGSNDYKAQYYDGAAWQNVGAAFVQVDGSGINVVINTTVTGTHNVRIIDTLTLNVSNVINIAF